jgi:hypothetical protein
MSDIVETGNGLWKICHLFVSNTQIPELFLLGQKVKIQQNSTLVTTEAEFLNTFQWVPLKTPFSKKSSHFSFETNMLYVDHY